MIRVDVHLYTILRHRPDGQIQGRLSLELQDGAAVADVLRDLSVPDDLPIVISVNDEQADPSMVLHHGDRVELIPAVAGGTTPPLLDLSELRGVPQAAILAYRQTSCYNETNNR